jgi:hypothetical protein
MFRLSSLDAAPKGTSQSAIWRSRRSLWLWLHTEGYRRSAAVRRILPGLPAEQTQFPRRRGRRRRDEVRARRIRDLQGTLERTANRELSACKKVLTSGVAGAGSEVFLKYIDPSKLHGIDVSDDMIAFCQKEFRWGTFTQNDPFLRRSFLLNHSISSALSVFSHLSEDAHRKWLEEFSGS